MLPQTRKISLNDIAPKIVPNFLFLAQSHCALAVTAPLCPSQNDSMTSRADPEILQFWVRIWQRHRYWPYKNLHCNISTHVQLVGLHLPLPVNGLNYLKFPTITVAPCYKMSNTSVNVNKVCPCPCFNIIQY